MPDEPAKPVDPGASKNGNGTTGAAAESTTGPSAPPPSGGADESARDRDRGLSDMFRRAVAAGLEAAGRSKDDFVRIASTEIRGWLDHLELDTELRKALSKMVLEVKAEIRFRPTEDGGVTPAAETEMRVRPAGKPDRDR
ncbi:MAG TPA: hypothetical protein VGF45_15200 [Polyangia bacterium]